MARPVDVHKTEKAVYQPRFEAKFIPIPWSGCWQWIGFTDKKGYGKFSLNRKSQLAQRISYELYISKIPIGLHALHHCDNPGCVRPDHLFLGTNEDNHIDKMLKGHGQFKLTRQNKIEICNSKLSGVVLSKMFGVTPSRICSVRKQGVSNEIAYGKRRVRVD